MWKSSVKLFLTKKSDHIRGWDFFFFFHVTKSLYVNWRVFVFMRTILRGRKKTICALYVCIIVVICSECVFAISFVYIGSTHKKMQCLV